MMNYNAFEEAVKEQIKDYLPPEFKEAEVQTVKMKRNNDVEKEGLSIKYSEKVCAVIYPKDLYILYQEGKPFREIMEKIAKAFVESRLSDELFYDMMYHYEAMKDKLFVSVCNASKNAEMLQNVPHEIREDLALIYKAYIILDEVNKEGTIVVNNEMMEIWGISEKELRDQAWKNMHTILPYTFRTMESVLQEYAENNELKEEAREALLRGAEEIDMYVLTNEFKTYGASYMFDLELLEQISQKLGGDFMVIPVSVHEVLLKKVDKDIGVADMKSIIEEVNNTGVEPEEILSNELYVFDSVEKKLSIAKVQDMIQDEEPELAGGLMSFQEFKETIRNEIRSYLPKDFDGQISIETVKRYGLPPNDELIIHSYGSEFVPHINLGPYYDFCKARAGMEAILRSIASTYHTEITRAQECARRTGAEECAGVTDEMVENTENDGQSFGMEQCM